MELYDPVVGLYRDCFTFTLPFFIKSITVYLQVVCCCYSGSGSVVGIATAYGLDGPGIESRWGEIFRTSPDRP